MLVVPRNTFVLLALDKCDSVLIDCTPRLGVRHLTVRYLQWQRRNHRQSFRRTTILTEPTRQGPRYPFDHHPRPNG